MRDDHPAEQYRAIITELDAAPPPPRPPARPTPPPPAPVTVAAPPAPDPFDWAALLAALRPVLIFTAVLVLGIALYLRLH